MEHKVNCLHMENQEQNKGVDTTHLEAQRLSKTVLSDVNQILIVPVGSSNFESSVATENGNSPLQKGLHKDIPNDIFESISEKFNKDDVRFYGCKNRKTDRNERCYRKITKNTLVIFQLKGKVVGLANIRGLLVSEHLAKWAWDDSEYKFIYTIENYVPTDLSIIDLTSRIYPKGSIVQNMRRLWKKEKVAKVLEYLNEKLNGK